VVVDPAIQNAAEDALQSGAELNLDFGAQRGALKALVPLYMEPDAGWYRVAAVASRISVIVILNPDNGPGTSPSADYMESIEELREAGVTVLGYVSTDYGAIAADKIHGKMAYSSTKYRASQSISNIIGLWAIM
jgi:hypothetical protein